MLKEQVINEILSWRLNGYALDRDSFYDDEAGAYLRHPNGHSMGELLIGFDELPGGRLRLVLRQLYLAQAQTGVGSELLIGLIEIMHKHPEIAHIDIPATDDGSYVWAKMGVRCVDTYCTLREQVMENFDQRLCEGMLGLVEDEVGPVLRDLRAALAQDDPVAALLELRAPDGRSLAHQVLEGAEWMGRIAREDAPALLVSLQARMDALGRAALGRPQLSKMQIDGLPVQPGSQAIELPSPRS